MVPHLAVAALVALACLGGCSSENRPIGRERARTPPTGQDDQRIAHYRDNRFQIARGSRFFAWYGCGSCHSDLSPDEALDLADGRWRHGGEFHQIFTSIADGHAPGTHAHAGRIPVEPLWQLAAYVKDLERNSPAMRRRNALDLLRERRGAP